MDDYDAATPKPVMVDLVTAGISSTSLFKYYVQFINSTPSLNSLAPLVFVGGQNNLNGTLSSGNPWLKYVDSDAQGYAVVTLTPTALNCTFKKMKQIGNDGITPASPAVASMQQVQVTAGTPAVTLVSAT
jgi:alkaline phosphatase D